jgi:aspartyl-tRNA(Asn)/glutamyl-tRNA(Gln) amidotransferase subunit B
LLDFNRSGVPLVEIVSRPEIYGAEQARAYAQELRSVILELGVSDARLEEGSMRFDANVSIRPQGSSDLGTKVEVKNMNSFRSLERAVEHEITRQVRVVESGGLVVQETRHWDEEDGVTHSMRTKEGSSDYRYFVEPDLVPMVLDREWVERVRQALPELPAERRVRYRAHGLGDDLAGVLSAVDPKLRAIYEDAVKVGANPKATANWVTGEIIGWMRRQEVGPSEVRLDGAALAELVAMIEDGKVSSSAAKEVLDGVLSGEGSPSEVAAERDLVQISDRGSLDVLVSQVLDENPKAVEGFRGGDQKVIGFLVGQVMKATGGKADPRLVDQLLREHLSA